MQPPLPMSADHWQFALACAVAWLHEKVYTFNFKKSLSGDAAYVGITPQGMVSSIDGFLSEKEIVPGGTASELEQLRGKLLESITPAYQSGNTTAHRLWVAAHDDERTRLMNTTPEDVAAEAWKRVPSDLSSSQANWFVEGFCYRWAQEWFAFQISHLNSQPQ